MPFKGSETGQFGLVIIGTNPLSPMSSENAGVMIPSNYWIRLMNFLPAPLSTALKSHARWGSISHLTGSVIQNSLAEMESRLGVTPQERQGFFKVESRQSVILAGQSPLGLHTHPPISWACTLAGNTLVPLCWPIMAARALLGTPPTFAQLVACVANTILLQAFKKWCQGGTTDQGTGGTPNPFST